MGGERGGYQPGMDSEPKSKPVDYVSQARRELIALAGLAAIGLGGMEKLHQLDEIDDAQKRAIAGAEHVNTLNVDLSVKLVEMKKSLATEGIAIEMIKVNKEKFTGSGKSHMGHFDLEVMVLMEDGRMFNVTAQNETRKSNWDARDAAVEDLTEQLKKLTAGSPVEKTGP